MAARRVDWSFGPGHGPVSGVINAAGSALGLTMVADLGHVGPVWGLVGGTVAAGGALVASIRQNAPGAALAYRSLCWMGAGGWSTYALASATAEPFSGPWSTPALASLTVGTIGAAFAGLAFRRSEEKEEAKRQAQEDAKLAEQVADDEARAGGGDHDRIAEVWRKRIKRVCHVDLDPNPGKGIVGVQMWDGDPSPGFTIDGNLPPGGAWWKTLKKYAEALASDARLPEGCSVSVEPGVDRGAFLMRVMTRNVLAEDKAYPREYPHETINDPRLLAYRADDQPVRVPLRQDVALIVGPTGSGKTNTMNVLIAEHLKCVDVIPCVIDFNGGSLAIPWLMPWRADTTTCPRPPIAWVADTPQKALTMTETILDVIKDRKQSYAHVKVAANETLLPISAEIPQFTIIIDESAEVLGAGAIRDPLVRRVADNVLEIQRIGRDSGGRLLISSLGATNETMGSRAVKIHSKVKLAMAGTPGDELGYLMDDYKIVAEDAKWEGSSHIKLGQDPPFLGKVPYILPAQIAEIACATSDRRCDPDERALQVMGDRWTSRWDDSQELLALLDAGVEAMRHGESMAAAVASVSPADRVEAASETAVPSHRQGDESAKPLADALADLEATKRRLREVEPVPDSGPREDELPPLPADADFSVVESWLTPGTPATDANGRRKPLPRQRMHQLVWDAGEDGIGPTAVHKVLEQEGYETTYQTVNGWMRDDARDGILFQAGNRAPYLRGPKLTNPYEG